MITFIMSEENKHTSEETESDMNTEDHSKEQSKSDTSMLNNETEQPMLEDEEMPTYVSVSSPSRRDDSDVNNTKQNKIPVEEDHSRSPCPSDDQGGGSIYVLSSGEESNHPYNDEDEDDYGDSDDMDEMDLENEHENAMLDDEEEEDDEDDDDRNPLRLPNEDDEDIETEYDQEYFDRVSDDFILNNRLKQHHKERSLSLQDLSICKNNIHSPYSKKRHSLNIVRPNYLKYQHVESKVKQYIRDIKKQNRKSMEKRIKEQEFIINKNYDEDENIDSEQVRATVTNKIIKDYAQKAIKDLQHEENEGTNLVYNIAQIVKNGENNKTDKVIENQFKHVRKDSEYTNTQNEKRAQNSDDRLEKRNGSVDINVHQIEYQNTLDRNTKFSNINQSSLVNGHEQTPAFINLRTVTYEEYMHGTPNTVQKEELNEQKQKNVSEVYNEAEMITEQEIDNSDTSCSLKIENVKSIRMSHEESSNLNFAKINANEKMVAENKEIIQLKTQLNQKDAQFHNLKDAYQKTLAENIKMKQELDELKKSLAKYENENKTCETKVASVQTENVEKSVDNQETVAKAETVKKVSTSSVASTASSSDQWAESAYSPAVSIKPPDITSILNSDDSIVLTNGTPRKLAHPLSRTFITSSRILQTLSNITQSKTKVESPLVRNTKKRSNENSTDQLLNLHYSSPIHTSSSKKRKATEMLGSAAFTQPFKIPHTTVEPDRKNSTDATTVEFKYVEEHPKSKSEQEQSASVNKNGNASTSAEVKTEETIDQNGVKCFIYAEDENTKNRSFLIQAEEPTKDGINDKNRVQECGPYLLGNLEVRMSEINGTISVWGKEVNREPANDNEDDAEVSATMSEKKSYDCWHNTPQMRFNESPLVCSTSRKLKIPCRFNKSNSSQYRRSLPVNAMRTSSLGDDLSDKLRMDHSFSLNNCVPFCENCDSPKYPDEWPIYKGASSSQEKVHSCCIHGTEFVDEERHCDVHHEKQKYDVSPKHSKTKFYSKGIRRNSYKNTFIPDTKNHLHENSTNIETNETTCKCHARRSFQNVVDNAAHSKYCNHVRNISYTCKSSLDNASNHETSEKHTCSHSISNEDEEDPLIPFKRSNETPETRQRRLSGKKVRGILMDLLRGCGDCRSNSAANLSKNEQHSKQAHTSHVPPQIKISSPSHEPTSSGSTQCNERCCHAYAQRIESQLEEFRMEMERVRSRSDAILDMLNMLHSVDMN
nr:PREDICTED: probable serine/threonine-protein kinase kinX isoform X1 [Megachile rotundata]